MRQAVFSCPFKAIRWTRQPRVKKQPSLYDGQPAIAISLVLFSFLKAIWWPSNSFFFFFCKSFGQYFYMAFFFCFFFWSFWKVPLFSGFPRLIEENVYYMGHSDTSTFGSAGFFIRHEGHNILIDPPIVHPQLLAAVEQMGGVQHLCFTHVDHTGNANTWHEATRAPRLMHKADVVETENNYTPFPVTKDFEVLLDLNVPGTSINLEGLADFQIIHTPGHTPGSIMFLYKKKFLFTGDSWFRELQVIF